MSERLSAGAVELSEWFNSVQRLTEVSLFAAAPEGPLRDAIVLDVLRRNARSVSEAALDTAGMLYSPICFFLAAACRHLRASLAVGHWRAALANVRDLRSSLASAQDQSAEFGLPVGTPATILKMEFDEAVRQAGLIEGTSFLSKADREVAVGLAINWPMRLLLAYSLEIEPRPVSSHIKDLPWLAAQTIRALAGDHPIVSPEREPPS
ncbi:MAG: hypothetical protein JNL98_18620 [Bryobacterales bacterium]|nr:hypothetical protein [Bryobacterales bacterium]